MKTNARWLETNERYLAAALALTRLRLLRQIELTQPFVAPSVSETDLAEACSAVEDAAIAEPAPAAAVLADRFGLSRFEQELLMLCAAVELDTRTAALCARAQDDPHRPFPTFALALAALPEPRWDALSFARPLRYWRFLEVGLSPTQPLTTSPLRIDERIVNYLKGLNQLDDRIIPLLSPLSARSEPLPASQQTIADSVIAGLQSASGADVLPLIQLVGRDASSKQLVAACAGAALGLRMCRVPVDVLMSQGPDIEVVARLWQRESLLMPLGLYLDADELEGAPDTSAAHIRRFLARAGGVVFLATREASGHLDRDCLTYDVATPTRAERAAAWRQYLDERGSDVATRLADQFDLGVGRIARIARQARALGDTAGTTDDARVLWNMCVVETRPRLHTLAQRIDTRATWNDIVLPEPELQLLKQIAAQVRHRTCVYDEWGFRRRMNRGLGIAALFSGESGTGKTMAAEVLANDLDLDLYRIDLSAVISKYIGETEKNLRRVFDTAESGGAILLFDEADALFGKRSEVKDSHDRYANIEVNYLLQRMEAYAGLAVLATNMKSALDSAFMRRLRFVVHFPFPAVAERRELWRRAFPRETPLADLDIDRLARLTLVGGSIHNIALNAAFLAARAGSPVTTAVALASAREEFRKLERPIDEADFRPPAVNAGMSVALR